MRVCYFGIYSTAAVYPRNNNIIKGLRAAGVTVDECRVQIEESFASRAAVAQSFARMTLFLVKLVFSCLVLFIRLLRIPRPDVFVVGNPGYFHIHFLRLVRAVFFRRVPIVYDIFIPLYDAIVCDRKYFSETSLAARLLHWFEGSVCRQADLCMLDTYVHCDYMAQEFKLDRDKLDKVFIGSSDELFPEAKSPPAEGSDFLVLQFGTFIPLHGLQTIVRAAKILEAEPGIKFIVVGQGQLEKDIKKLAEDLNVKNLEFKGWVPIEKMHDMIAKAHVCMGIFGTTEKTKRVIPIKAFDTLAVGRPLISADTPAIQEAFTDGRNIRLVPIDDPQSLADAIKALKHDPELRESIAAQGHELYKELFTPDAIGKQFIKVLKNHFPELSESET